MQSKVVHGLWRSSRREKFFTYTEGRLEYAGNTTFDYLKRKREREERERPNAEEQAHRQKVKMDVRAMDCGWGLGVSFRFAMIVPENPIC